MCMPSDRGRQCGITLIELIMFILVVSVGLVGVLSAMNVSVRGSADPLLYKQSLAIAEATMEEILLKDFANPSGGYTGSDRSRFDDVQDFDGYDVTGVRDLAGFVITGLAAYRVRVTVTSDSFCVNPTSGAAEAKKILVTVTSPGNDDFKLTGYRCKY